MPELPEAEVTAQQLRSRVLGASIVDWTVRRRDIFREGYPTLSWYRGSHISSVTRQGKSVVLACTKEAETRFLAAELGMTGLLLFKSAPVKLPQHTHVVLYVDGGQEPELRYWNPRRFGRLYLLDARSLERFTARRFGCDALTVSRDEFVEVIKGRRSRLKALLMQQQTVAGIGNIYANEILFRAGLHPLRVASRLRRSTIERLHETMQQVLRDAIAYGGSSVRDFLAPDGTEGRYKQHHLVYGKQGQPCPNRCGRTIRRLIGARSSYYCAMCQTR
jgi:formamidopyrimidine-DNA glycosylase